MRLGKIEKYILCWIYRQHRPPEDYHSKSGALLSYARKYYDTQLPKLAHNIKSHIPENVYNKLHVSFYRSLKTLAEKGLIEYEYLLNPREYEMDLRSKTSIVKRPWFHLLHTYSQKTGRRDKYIRKSICRLTTEGKKMARKLLLDKKKIKKKK